MPYGVTDEVFGKIRWSEDKWETTASFEYFRGSGERVPLTEKDRESMPPVDRLEMDLQTGEKRRKPDERQREAWKKILERGDALWDEALDAMIEEYRRQWPLRARYWRVSGELGLMDRMLPERVDRQTMWQMVVPLSCTLEWPDPKDGAVEFFLVFIVTWYSEPLSVYVRDGRVSDVVPMSVFMSRRGPHHTIPAFGTVYRGKGDAMPWAGDVEIAPFNSWAAVAVDRGQWEERSKRSDERSPLPWDLARGWSSLLVYLTTSPTGCRGMWQNVAEWCENRPEEFVPRTVQLDFEPGVHRSFRGGTVLDKGWPCCATGGYQLPQFRHFGMGFRLAVVDA